MDANGANAVTLCMNSGQLCCFYTLYNMLIHSQHPFTAPVRKTVFSSRFFIQKKLFKSSICEQMVNFTELD